MQTLRARRLAALTLGVVVAMVTAAVPAHAIIPLALAYTATFNRSVTPTVAASAAANTGPGALVLHQCQAGSYLARCGTLMVAEDRLSGRGPKIPIRVVVVPATGAPRQPDPIVYFDGGPGASAVDDAAQQIAELSLDTTRDYVFIDQRGTGASNLTCPALPGLGDPSLLRSKVAACLAHTRADLRYYTTAMATDDAAEVLSDLGYRTADLVGGSYGVMAAQVFVLRHPHMVRTMTLLSGPVLSVPMYEREPQSAQEALDRVFAECAAQPQCHRAFPRLTTDWASVWRSISAAPWVIPARLSPTGKQAVIDSDGIASAMHQLLLDALTQVDIPLIVHTLAVAKGRPAALAALAQTFSGEVGDGGSSRQQLLVLTIRCNEPWEAWEPAHLVGTSSFEYRYDLENAKWWQAVCAMVPKAGAAAGPVVLRPSPVPVLALNGEEDPQDPPAVMAGAKALWPNSLELAVPNQGHHVNPQSSGACMMNLVASFIERANAADLDTSCLQAVPAPSFVLS